MSKRKKLKAFEFEYSDHYFCGFVFAENASKARAIAFNWIQFWESETPLGICDHSFFDFPIRRCKKIDDLCPPDIDPTGAVISTKEIDDRLDLTRYDYNPNRDIYEVQE